MAKQAEGPDVGEIALAASFNDRHNVVRIPQRFTRARTKSPVRQEQRAAGSAREPEPPRSYDRVNSALGADAAVAVEDLLAKVGWLAAQFPLMHAELRAESETPARNFERAPTAQAAAIGAAWH